MTLYTLTIVDDGAIVTQLFSSAYAAYRAAIDQLIVPTHYAQRQQARDVLAIYVLVAEARLAQYEPFAEWLTDTLDQLHLQHLIYRVEEHPLPATANPAHA